MSIFQPTRERTILSRQTSSWPVMPTLTLTSGKPQIHSRRAAKRNFHRGDVTMPL
jgi:hypothetical protein